nr:PREDICTED: C-X-C chemokine receptor type 3-like [Lepisosteus oculatus]
MDSSDSMDDGGKITLYDEDLWSLFDNDTENNTYNNSCCEDMGDVCTQGVGLGFQRLFLPALYSVALVLGVLGNGLVIAVLCQFRRGWSVTDTFILNLALADTLLVVTLPFWKQKAIRIILALVVAFFLCWTPYNLTLLADTLHSQSNISDSHGRRTALDISLVATSSLGYLHCCLNPILYAFVGVKFRRNLLELLRALGCKIKGHARPKPASSSATRRTSMWSESGDKQKAIRIILALVVAFFLCWTPYNLTLLADTLHSQSNISDSHGRRTALDISLVATSSLGYLHCCLNPILYAFVGVKFRRNLLELLRALGCPSRAAENKTEEEEGEKNCVVYRAGDEQVRAGL